MKILYITQFFPPETGAASTRAAELVKYWAYQGNNVTVLTGFPNYPMGKLHDGYRNRFVRKIKYKNVTIIRTYTYIPKYRSIILRVINQALFTLLSIFGGMFVGDPDVIIASSPPFCIGFVGYILSRKYKKKYIFEVRDLFPETAISFGIIKNRMLIRALRKIENFYYIKSNAVVGVTESMCEYLVKVMENKKKVHMITNGVNIEKFRKLTGTAFKKRHGIDDKFIVMYIGILGRAENLEVFIEAANILRNNKNIIFVLVGEGVLKEELKNKAKCFDLRNILFIDGQPAEKIPDIIGAANLCFASRKDNEINYGALPVKIFEYMACEKPVIACLKGEAATMINAAHAGLCIDPNDYEKLAEEILKLSNNKMKCEEYGKLGREFVIQNFDRDKLSDKYLEMLNKV